MGPQLQYVLDHWLLAVPAVGLIVFLAVLVAQLAAKRAAARDAEVDDALLEEETPLEQEYVPGVGWQVQQARAVPQGAARKGADSEAPAPAEPAWLTGDQGAAPELGATPDAYELAASPRGQDDHEGFFPSVELLRHEPLVAAAPEADAADLSTELELDDEPLAVAQDAAEVDFTTESEDLLDPEAEVPADAEIAAAGETVDADEPQAPHVPENAAEADVVTEDVEEVDVIAEVDDTSDRTLEDVEEVSVVTEVGDKSEAYPEAESAAPAADEPAPEVTQEAPAGIEETAPEVEVLLEGHTEDAEGTGSYVTTAAADDMGDLDTYARPHEADTDDLGLPPGAETAPEFDATAPAEEATPAEETTTMTSEPHTAPRRVSVFAAARAAMFDKRTPASEPPHGRHEAPADYPVLDTPPADGQQWAWQPEAGQDNANAEADPAGAHAADQTSEVEAPRLTRRMLRELEQQRAGLGWLPDAAPAEAAPTPTWPALTVDAAPVEAKPDYTQDQDEQPEAAWEDADTPYTDIDADVDATPVAPAEDKLSWWGARKARKAAARNSKAEAQRAAEVQEWLQTIPDTSQGLAPAPWITIDLPADPVDEPSIAGEANQMPAPDDVSAAVTSEPETSAPADAPLFPQWPSDAPELPTFQGAGTFAPVPPADDSDSDNNVVHAPLWAAPPPAWAAPVAHDDAEPDELLTPEADDQQPAYFAEPWATPAGPLPTTSEVALEATDAPAAPWSPTLPSNYEAAPSDPAETPAAPAGEAPAWDAPAWAEPVSGLEQLPAAWPTEAAEHTATEPAQNEDSPAYPVAPDDAPAAMWGELTAEPATAAAEWTYGGAGADDELPTIDQGAEEPALVVDSAADQSAAEADNVETRRQEAVARKAAQDAEKEARELDRAAAQARKESEKAARREAAEREAARKQAQKVAAAEKKAAEKHARKAERTARRRRPVNNDSEDTVALRAAAAQMVAGAAAAAPAAPVAGGAFALVQAGLEVQPSPAEKAPEDTESSTFVIGSSRRHSADLDHTAYDLPEPLPRAVRSSEL